MSWDESAVELMMGTVGVGIAVSLGASLRKALAFLGLGPDSDRMLV